MLCNQYFRLVSALFVCGAFLASTPCDADFSQGITTVLQFREGPGKNKQLKVAGVSWECGENYCRSNMPVKDASSACKAMALKFGEITLYRSNNLIMPAKDLASCNSVIKGRQGMLARNPVSPVVVSSLQQQASTGKAIASSLNAGTDITENDESEKVFRLDAKGGSIQFGDGVHGDVPATSRTTTARYGEQPDQKISKARPDLTIKHVVPVTGGTDAESVDETGQRIPGNLRHRNRVVTGNEENRRDKVYVDVWTETVTQLEDGQVRDSALDGISIEADRIKKQCGKNRVLNAKGVCQCPSGTTAYRDKAGRFRCKPKLPCADGKARLDGAYIQSKAVRCQKSEFQALPEFDADTNPVAIEPVKIEHEEWKRDPK